MDVKIILPRIVWLQGETVYGRALIPEKEECEVFFYLFLHLAATTTIQQVDAANTNDVIRTNTYQHEKNFPIYCIKTVPTLLSTTSKGKECAFSLPLPKDVPPSLFNGPTKIVFANKDVNIEHRLGIHLLKSGKIETVHLDIMGLVPPPKPISMELKTDKNHVQIRFSKDSISPTGIIEGELVVVMQQKPASIKATFAFFVSDESNKQKIPPDSSTVLILKDAELKKPIIGKPYKIYLKFENCKRLVSFLIPGLMKFESGIRFSVSGFLGFSGEQNIFIPLMTGVTSFEEFRAIYPQYILSLDLKPFKSLQIDPNCNLIQTPIQVLDPPALSQFNDKIFKNNKGPTLIQNYKGIIEFIS
jgi:hypothetical protein